MLLGLDPANNHERAIALYREHFSEIGLYENMPYDGIALMLQRLGAAFTLYVCTSKPTVFAERILEKFAFADYFRAIYGSELDGTRGNKAELLAWMLDRESLDARDVLLVGDRMHDMRAAVENSAVGAGVLWGYGSMDELRSAGATHVFALPEEITPDALRELSRIRAR